jgi:hypothetical protein
MPDNQYTYELEGTLLEACNCNVLCPCWIGEDPDNGTCQAITAHHFDRGVIRGVDVSGLTWAAAAFIPGNILEGGIKEVVFVDETATPEQVQALTDAFQGRLGGPLADTAGLVSEFIGPYQVPIEHELVEGKGSVTVGAKISASMEPYRGPDGTITTLRDSIFSTIPGSAAWVSKASSLAVDIPEHGFTWTFNDTNAIQGVYVVRG